MHLLSKPVLCWSNVIAFQTSSSYLIGNVQKRIKMDELFNHKDTKMVLSDLNHLPSSHWMAVALHTLCVVLSWQVFLYSLMLMRTDMEINTTALGLWLRTKVLTPEPTPLIQGSGEIPQHVLDHGIYVLSKSFFKESGYGSHFGIGSRQLFPVKQVQLLPTWMRTVWNTQNRLLSLHCKKCFFLLCIFVLFFCTNI